MRILIVDDDPIVADSLSTILSAQEDIDVVAQGANGPESVTLYAQNKPDVLLMDIQMPGGDGLEAAEQILAIDPQARIVFLTTFADDEYIVRALHMGARGYLIKQDIARIAPALRSVMAGMRVLEGQVLESSALRVKLPGSSARASEFDCLTDREYEVVEAVSEGLDNAEIAQALFMSEGTVRNHISSILAKLGLRNRTQIAVLYYRSGQQV
ncbi:response regulator transcription factor [Actinobaculum sp. 313]|uniref:response regulator n=1 Tax=Actinobaculum sp. 313 TaxID=2495645 RepID=UPI000D526435|nr:response regulator transcription factor [Actinobaculum sp. 313]AWE42247.1 DNA-binding response regulator [Actinobaculum sp. 313]